MTVNLDHYRTARVRYDLPAVEAIAYARNRALLTDPATDAIGWDVDVDPIADEGPALMLYIYEQDDDDFDARNVVDCIGGIDADFTVSDHGNVHADYHDPYLVHLAADLTRDYLTG